MVAQAEELRRGQVHVHGGLLRVEVPQQPAQVPTRGEGRRAARDGVHGGRAAGEGEDAVVVEVAAVGDDGLEEERREVRQRLLDRQTAGVGHGRLAGPVALAEQHGLGDARGAEDDLAGTRGLVVLEATGDGNAVGVVGSCVLAEGQVFRKGPDVEDVVSLDHLGLHIHELDQVAVLH